MLQCCVCRLSVLWRYVLWLNGACKSYYWEPIGSRIWEIDWYQNEWPWPMFRGRVKVTSTIALHSTLNILETVRDRDFVPKDHQYEMAYGLWNGHVTDDVTWPPKELWGSTVGYRSDSLAACILSCFVSVLFIVNALSSCAPDFIQFIMFLLIHGIIQRCISTLLSCLDCGLTGLSKLLVFFCISVDSK